MKLQWSIFPLLFFLGGQAFAQSHIPRFEPDPLALAYYEAGRQKQGYSWTELAEISLWASGDTRASNLQGIKSAVSSLLNSKDLPSSGRDRAEYILTYLHRYYLRTYSTAQTGVDIIFTHGRYNCVSSAVLYMIFCEAAGVEVSPVMTKDHSLVTVRVNGAEIDVETTNRYGFDPGDKKEFHDQFGRLTGFTYTSQRNYHERQNISKIELVSLIFYNRIKDYNRQNRYADAVPLAVDRAAMLTGDSLAVNYQPRFLFEDPRSCLLESLLNHGAYLLRTNREEDCLSWVKTASLKYQDENWRELSAAAVNNRVVRFVKEKKAAEARDFLESNKNIISEGTYENLDIIVVDAELLNRAGLAKTAAEGDSVLADIAKARAGGVIDAKRAYELRNYAVLNTASALCAPPEKNWRAAVQYIEKALAAFGSDRELEQRAAIYLGNVAVDYHNRFAELWNSASYAEAERILNAALAEFPNDRRLLSDMEIVNRWKASSSR